MNLKSRYSKVILAVLALFLVQSTCVDNVDRTDPRILETVDQMSDAFIAILDPLQVSPPGVQLPPIISQISIDSANNIVTVSGKSRNDPFEMVSPSGSIDAKILIYRIKLIGCGQEPEPIGDPLAEVPVLANRNWTAELKNMKPSDVIGAKQVFNGKETGLSNLKLVSGEILNLDNIDKLKKTEYFLNAPILITGSSVPGACVVIQNEDTEYGREGSDTVEKEKTWGVEILIRKAENQYRVYVEGWDDVVVPLTLRGSTPNLQWPYKDRDTKVDGSCKYKDTKDKQEIQVNNCYYKFPISGWYGSNDFYKQAGFANGFHNALDIAGTSGSDVLTVAKGEVFYVNISDTNGTGGNYVLIDHGSWVSVYMHLSTISIDGLKSPTVSTLIKPTKTVEAGQKIGETGATGCFDGNGNRCGPHLHLSIFLWTNGYREVSLKENSIPSIPWTKDSTAFKLININPPAGVTLGSNVHYQTGELLGAGENSTDRLADRRNADKPEVYFSPYDFWKDVNWNEIRINEYGCASGTKFDELDENNQCPQTP